MANPSRPNLRARLSSVPWLTLALIVLTIADLVTRLRRRRSHNNESCNRNPPG